MLAHDATNEHPATSLSKFFASHVKQYEAMANAPINATNSDRREMIKIETKEMHEMNKRGATINQIAKRYGVAAVTVSKRLRSRGYKVIYNKGGMRRGN